MKNFEVHLSLKAPLALVLLFGQFPAVAEEVPRKVGVWYLTLFYSEGYENPHWAGVKSRGQAVPVAGPESSRNPAVMERQFRQMKQCGIDFMVMDDTNCVWVDSSRIDHTIRAWFDFMDAKPAAERIPLAIAVGGELNQHGNKDAWTEAVEYLWNTYAHRPSHLKVDGKPVLHWYIEKDVWPDWDDKRWTIRRTYHFFRMDGQMKHGGWGFGSDTHPPCLEECMSFHPGWDLSPPGIPREDGDTYRRRWINALKCMPRHVLLSDWNGWAEGTALEDSDRWKDTYGNAAPSWYRMLTQGYVAAYKGRLVKDFYYRDESLPHLYRWDGNSLKWTNAYPKSTPAIVLPAGRLESLARMKLPAAGQ